MPGARQEKLIAEKYDLDYPQRALATRVWKRRWTWVALGLGIALGAGVYLYQGRAAFWAGAVSPSHGSFADDCQKCHTSSWQAALRLVSFDSARHSVSDAACLNCHKAGDHHPRGGVSELACARCHQEHRPDHPLLAVSDRNCTSCHADLNSLSGDELHFVAEIASFDAGTQGHPEFALLRADHVPTTHGAWQVAAFADRAWHDAGGILFNHKAHLAAGGVLNGERKKVNLNCGDCHQPRDDGVSMKPIVYERHCAACHPLRLAESLATLGDLPHETPELVRGAIRERAAKLKSTDSLPAPSAAIPRLPRPTAVAVDQAASVEAIVAGADHAVFGLEAKGLCRKCHHFEIRDGEWQVLAVNPAFTIVDESAGRSMIPDRWFSHGGFDHGQHLTIECTDCHSAAESALTSDILLPGIADCRQCHGTTPTKLAQGAVADCTSCHEYHGRTLTASHDLTEAAP